MSTVYLVDLATGVCTPQPNIPRAGSLRQRDCLIGASSAREVIVVAQCFQR